MAAQVLSVGSCSADDYRLKRFVQEHSSAIYSTAPTAEEGLQVLSQRPFDLVLVNRIIDWDGSLGVDFIAAAKQAGITTPMMLVSDYPDAQAQAIANGAMPGIGKSELHDPTAADRLRHALQPKAPVNQR